ncbi:hypothetical protein BH10ACI1_BH10ACI1_00580 [soil metagenome]
MQEIKDSKSNTNSDKLVEGIDYYFDKELMVLTASFLKKRNYCCRNGCRHCPYPKARQKNLQ